MGKFLDIREAIKRSLEDPTVIVFTVSENLEFPQDFLTDFFYGKTKRIVIFGNGKGLHQLPDEIGNFEKLETLIIKNHKLTSIPTTVGNLQNLTNLNLSGNQITKLPKAIFYLSSLKELDVSFNKIRNLPGLLRNLNSLEKLDISHNQLYSFEKPILQLRKLKFLSLRKNKIAAIPRTIRKLNELRFLDVSKNRVKRIPDEIGGLKGLKILLLNKNKIRELPSRITKLYNLRTLDVSGNKIQKLPIRFDKFKKIKKISIAGNYLQRDSIRLIFRISTLTSLNISSCRINEFPNKLPYITNLRTIDMSHNNLRVLPKNISLLQKIRKINFSFNKIEKIPIEIYNLDCLCYINFDTNGIKEISETIGRLQNLEYLNLSNNKLNTLPSSLGDIQVLRVVKIDRNPIDELPKRLFQSESLSNLKVSSGHISFPPLEILDISIEGNVNIQNVKIYLEDLSSGKVVTLKEIKVLVVGNKRVGKTSLINRIKFNFYNENESRTHGVDVSSMQLGENNIKLNIWDFGGDEIYHGTHRFFFSSRSLYLLVWDRYTNDIANSLQDIDFQVHEYWLDWIKNFSVVSPVLMIQNKVDLFSEKLRQKKNYRKHYNVKKFVNVSAATGENIDQLLSEIEEVISSEPELEKVLSYPIPLKWLNIRSELQKFRLTKNYLSYGDYLSLCQRENITERAAATLSHFLHNIGEIQHFSNHPFLYDYIFLKPEWITKVAYSLLYDEFSKLNGIVSRSKIEEMLSKTSYISSNTYNRKDLSLVLELLKKFEILIYNDHRKEYIIPQYLPQGGVEVPEKINKSSSIRFRIKQNFIHRGSFYRFIVRLNDLIYKDQVSSTEVLLEANKTFAKIFLDVESRTIGIDIYGENTFELLSNVRRTFRSLFSRYEFKEYICCICDTCQFSDSPQVYNYASIVDLYRSKKYKQVPCKKGNTFVKISVLLNRIEFNNSFKDRIRSIKKLLSRGYCEKPLDQLMDILKEVKFRELQNELTLLKARLGAAEREQANGIITQEDLSVVRNQVIFFMIKLVEDNDDLFV